MDVKSRVRPLEHRLRLLLVEQRVLDEEPGHRATKRFGEQPDVVRRPAHERAVGAKTAVGHTSP